MTEQEWQERDNPKQLLEYLGTQRGVSDRKLLLFAAACCRRIWGLLSDPRSRLAVDLLESWLDGGGDIQEARRLAVMAFREGQGYGKWAPWEALRQGRPHVRAGAAAVWAARAVAATISREGINGDQRTFAAERRHQCVLLRDIVGNPFRPEAAGPSPIPPAVALLSQAAYAERDPTSGHLDPARFAVLADALEEAGCDNAELLGHLRDPGPHLRGCWALDRLLGKE